MTRRVELRAPLGSDRPVLVSESQVDAFVARGFSRVAEAAVAEPEKAPTKKAAPRKRATKKNN